MPEILPGVGQPSQVCHKDLQLVWFTVDGLVQGCEIPNRPNEAPYPIAASHFLPTPLAQAEVAQEDR